MAEHFDPYYEWLGIPPKDQPPHAYRLLGLELFEANLKVIDSAAEQRMLLLRTRRLGKYSADAERLLNEISQVQRLLLDPQNKQAYDSELRSKVAAASIQSAPLPRRFAEPVPPQAVLPSPHASASPASVTPAAVAPIVSARAPLKKRSPKKLPVPLIAALAISAVIAVGLALLFIFTSATEPPVAKSNVPASRPPAAAKTPTPPGSTVPKVTPVAPIEPARVGSEKKTSPPKGKTKSDDGLQGDVSRNLADLVQPEIAYDTFDWYSELRKIDVDKADAWESVVSLYTQAVSKRLPRKEQFALFRRLLDCCERLIENDQFNLAEKLLDTAEKPLSASDYPLQLKRLFELRQRQAAVSEQFMSAKEAIERIEQASDDAAANAKAGAYYCFAKGEWKRGLPLLRMSDDSKLQKIASDDSAMPTTWNAQLKLADAWWTYADSIAQPQQSGVRLRAGQWYREALRGLKSGDTRRVRERIEELLPQGLVRLGSPEEETLFVKDASVYLDDLDEEFSAQSGGHLGRHGETGFAKLYGCDEVIWQGQRAEHSLFMHPPSNGHSTAIYRLGGSYRNFRGTVGIAESPRQQNPPTPAIFRVFGDDRLLWESQPQGRRGAGETFNVDITHVDVLSLHIACPGDLTACHGVWIDPQLTGAVYAFPNWRRRSMRADEIYLDDLREADSIVGYSRLTGFGSTGITIPDVPVLAEDNGRRLMHSLVMVPQTDATAEASYYLAARFQSLQGRVGIIPEERINSNITPLTFILLGDGKELWKSPELKTQGQFEEYAISVEGIDKLTLRVQCPGILTSCWATWLEPLLTPKRSTSATTATGPLPIRADEVVLWNTHNGHQADRGVERCNLLLYRGDELVWQQTGIRLPWNGESQDPRRVPVPALPFDRLRVEITDFIGRGPGMAEVEVYDGKENVASKGVVSSSLSWSETAHHEFFSALNINDGLKDPEKFATGYVLLSDATNGWLELEWQPTTTRKHTGLKYSLKQHPHSAVPFQGHFYSYYASGIPLEDAHRHCQRMGGYLACVGSKEENDFLNKLSGSRRVWIGLRRKPRDGFQWLTGDEPSFANWEPGQPDNAENRENFFEMLSTGAWNDIVSPWEGNRGFICEWEF